jgi:hypothetical protein
LEEVLARRMKGWEERDVLTRYFKVMGICIFLTG